MTIMIMRKEMHMMSMMNIIIVRTIRHIRTIMHILTYRAIRTVMEMDIRQSENICYCANYEVPQFKHTVKARDAGSHCLVDTTATAFERGSCSHNVAGNRANYAT